MKQVAVSYDPVSRTFSERVLSQQEIERLDKDWQEHFDPETFEPRSLQKLRALQAQRAASSPPDENPSTTSTGAKT